MSAYITGIGCVSPQKTWDHGVFDREAAGHTGRMMQCLEPDMDPGLDDKYLRRMSRSIRLAWLAAKMCLDDAGGARPDAIVTGSGWGSVLDSEKFLLSIYKNKENFLPPTPFIQSTHNAVGAQIAMLLKSKDYNMSYGHGNFAFEQALADGIMRIENGESRSLLAGGFDEITANQFTLMDRLGQWRREPLTNLQLFSAEEEGTLAGEGFTFFLLQDRPGAKTYAALKWVETVYDENIIATDSQIRERLSVEGTDLVIAGYNGDRGTDRMYEKVLGSLFPEGVGVVAYKHLCGEYHTASAFAMWIAAVTLQHGLSPALRVIGGARSDRIRNILIYNQFKGIRHSFIKLSLPF